MYVANPTVFTIDTVDWTDHISGVELAGAEEIIDGRTFGKPRRTTTGGGQDSVTIMCKWSDAFHALYAAEAGSDVAMVLTVDGGTWSGTIHVPATAPKPSFQIGTLVEVPLVCGAELITYAAAP